MAGLLIKGLLVRGDLHRCLICAPGSIVGGVPVAPLRSPIAGRAGIMRRLRIAADY
jgi:hypothetical protein